jgi:transcriptional regulator with XRE-family HTH domain
MFTIPNMDTFFLQGVATELKAIRTRRGLTQAAVAELARLPRVKVLQVEKGLPTVSAGAYAAVARALGARLAVAPYRLPTLEETRALFAED